MADHPYLSAPDYRRWSRAIGAQGIEADPVVSWPWRLTRDLKVAAAGSCFAQHIARYLKASGFTFLVTEPAHPILGAEIGETFGYDVYSARFGNIYSSRQLLQLFRRAFGRFQPAEPPWEAKGRWFDPWRPSIQPEGFASRREFELDQAQHLAAVRAMFQQLDVFVFTLGLTEIWASADDGAAFPICPGVVAGEFDPQRHVFVNLNVAEVVADLQAFVTELHAVNPRARIIFTVSPVPLAATAEDRHVLVSTAYSKSVLRAAVDHVRRMAGVDYFPSYEIITGPQARGRYFAEDLRSITEGGVERVMDLFFRHVAGEAIASPVSVAEVAASAPAGDFTMKIRAAIDVLCDENELDASPGAAERQESGLR
jgi:hypothetical protein